MEKRPESPRPQGTPRWVAMVHRPADGSWRTAAESPHRSPVLYALGEMAHTLRARGEDVTFALWGPKDGEWHLHDTPQRPATAPRPSTDAAPTGEPAGLTERMTGRRHQVLMAGLTKAGLYELTPEDETTVQTLVQRLDESTVRHLAHWLATAGTR
ncbi:hypothetical protein GCM10023086_25810 [Streptomyces venetus]|uniref:MarR family transcriptional regulator n=1 Tax=Streptomyces venetus TaxID=1701086 RepID=A0ABP8FMU0_9ACTN